VSGVVRVVADDLKLSASQVDMHADSLRLSHGTADTQIEAAQSGCPQEQQLPSRSGNQVAARIHRPLHADG